MHPSLLFGAIVAGLALASSSGMERPAASQARPAAAPTQDTLNRIRADLFARAEHLADDIRQLKEILATNPGSVEGHLLLGLAYRTQGSAELTGEAIAEFRQAVALDSRVVTARFYLAHMYLDLGRPARARDEMEAALVIAPGNPQFLALLGEAERQLGNPKRSIDVTRRALQADPSFSQGRYYLGLALFDAGDREGAIAELERVVESAPAAAEPYLSLGTIYTGAGRFDDALKVLQLGTKLDPSRPDLRIQLARAYRSKGLLEKADEQLKLATPKSTMSVLTPVYQQVQSDLYLEQALLRLQQGRVQLAATAFKKVLEMDVNNGQAHRGLAEVYLRQGSYALSLEHATRAESLGFPLPDDRRKLLQEKLQGKETGHVK